MLEDAVVVDSTDTERESSPEQRLWMSALILLIDDARQGWLTDFTGDDERSQIRWDAWCDLIDAGPQLQNVCEFTGDDPTVISKRFTDFCNTNPPGSMSSRKKMRVSK